MGMRLAEQQIHRRSDWTRQRIPQRTLHWPLGEISGLDVRKYNWLFLKRYRYPLIIISKLLTFSSTGYCATIL